MAYLVTFAAFVIGNWNLTKPLLFYPIGIVLVLLALFPYLADRLMAPRLHGFVATLIFPLAYTTFEYLLSFGLYGTWFSLAYTQYGNSLPSDSRGGGGLFRVEHYRRSDNVHWVYFS